MTKTMKYATGDTVVYENVGYMFRGTIIRAYFGLRGTPVYDIRYQQLSDLTPGIYSHICEGVAEYQIQEKLEPQS